MWSDPPENDHFSGPQPTCFIQLSWKFTERYIHQNPKGFFFIRRNSKYTKISEGKTSKNSGNFRDFGWKNHLLVQSTLKVVSRGSQEKSDEGFVGVENTIWVLVFSKSAQNGWIRFCTWSPWHTFNHQIWPSAKFKWPPSPSYKAHLDLLSRS